MKRLTLIIALTVGSICSGIAGNYRINDEQLQQVFDQSVEVSFSDLYLADNALQGDFMKMTVDGGQTRGGYLLRAFFCGGIALHRYYMGTTRGGMWAMYCCIPVVGGLNAFVDFWWAVFESDAYTKYANNDKYIVWLD